MERGRLAEGRDGETEQGIDKQRVGAANSSRPARDDGESRDESQERRRERRDREAERVRETGTQHVSRGAQLVHSQTN